MKYPNLFHPLNESVIDRASNGKFTFGSLIGDFKHHDEGAKTEQDKAARHFIKHGEIPESYRQKMNNPDQLHDQDDGENIKEETKMPFFKLQEECACGKANCNCDKEGTGVCKADGLLHKIPINQYQDTDSNFVGDGESSETSKTNIPSLLAAKTAGGSPDPKVVKNGINQKASNAEVFKVKPVSDDGF